MSEERPKESKSQPVRGSTADIGSKGSSFSRVEAKATKDTLRAWRSSLDKGRQLVAMGRQKFDDEWVVQDAAITTVTQLAEAAKRLPKSFRDARPEIPWRNVIGMRDIVLHEYAIVDLPIVWEALERGFPEIEQSVFPK